MPKPPLVEVRAQRLFLVGEQCGKFKVFNTVWSLAYQLHLTSLKPCQPRWTSSASFRVFKHLASQVLEWSKAPAAALGNAIYLNDRYNLDGRALPRPNKFAKTGCLSQLSEGLWRFEE